MVFVELPQVGDTLTARKSFGVVESVKAVSDVFAPLNGKVTAINEALLDAPETINRDAFGSGWIVEIEISNPGETANLLDAAQYEQLLQEEA